MQPAERGTIVMRAAPARGSRAERALGAWLRRAACLILVALAWGAFAPPTAAAGAGWPVSGAIVRGFDPPEVAWGAGHRGVDLAGEIGEEVRAPRSGVVSFAATLAGRPVLVIAHDDGTRTTLEPVEASIETGRAVAAGDVVGRLAAGHPCPAAACLHWGLKRGEDYLDPVPTGGGVPLLLPDTAAAAVTERASQRAQAARAAAEAGTPGATSGAPPPGGGILSHPADARLGSRFGPRFHPIFKQWRLHAGVDLSNACGTPLFAAGDGTVSHMGFDASGGWRLVIDHGPVAGVRLQTVYLHAQGYRVRAGDRVTRGQQVGTMGSTGWSTGCHLHFSTKVDGRQVDPLPWIG
ncbi:M23 family metallopeptidase [Propioniciclava coleopterorum]|uniref:M23 family metallopeptidase n=1 Tax=Propioniciclava coleopterorum TaxID=2714937 RepID=A0A6G7Y8E3_9ACTN|nr:M23 family metallopeptidase [Propioniciclava coleopterorum]QIK73085.1 M23 family metallopeptidase [Propioniciclava coleopterorum]